MLEADQEHALKYTYRTQRDGYWRSKSWCMEWTGCNAEVQMRTHSGIWKAQVSTTGLELHTTQAGTKHMVTVESVHE